MNEVREELGFRNALKLRINFCTGGVKGNVHIEVQGVVVKKYFFFLKVLDKLPSESLDRDLQYIFLQ